MDYSCHWCDSHRNAEAAFLSGEQVQGRIWAQAPLARTRQPTQVGVFCRQLLYWQSIINVLYIKLQL